MAEQPLTSLRLPCAMPSVSWTGVMYVVYVDKQSGVIWSCVSLWLLWLQSERVHICVRICLVLGDKGLIQRLSFSCSLSFHVCHSVSHLNPSPSYYSPYYFFSLCPSFTPTLIAFLVFTLPRSISASLVLISVSCPLSAHRQHIIDSCLIWEAVIYSTPPD